MRNFKVTVNGRVYDVSVEENGGAGEVKAGSTVKTEAAPVASEGISKPVTVAAGDLPINSPLAGTIMSIKVKPGDTVKNGQVLLTLEALKMENEIVAPQDGVVADIYVQAGSNVKLGDVLLSLRS